jgi:hypothetical protein|nr:MAG TPA: hypothetical protein [Caudoviricetes sp.]
MMSSTFNPYQLHYNDGARFRKFVKALDKTYNEVFSNAMYKFTIECRKYNLLNKTYVYKFNEDKFGKDINKYLLQSDNGDQFQIIYNLLRNVGSIRIYPAKWYGRSIKKLMSYMEYTDCDNFIEYADKHIRPYFYKSIILSLNLYINVHNYIIQSIVNGIKSKDRSIKDIKIYKFINKLDGDCMFGWDVSVFNHSNICAGVHFEELSTGNTEKNHIVKTLMTQFDNTINKHRNKLIFYDDPYPLEILNDLLDDVLIYKHKNSTTNLTFKYYLDILTYNVFDVMYKDGTRKIYNLHKYHSNISPTHTSLSISQKLVKSYMLSRKENVFTFQHDRVLSVTEVTDEDYSTFVSLMNPNNPQLYEPLYMIQTIANLTDTMAYTPPLPSNLDKYKKIIKMAPKETLATSPMEHLYYYINNSDISVDKHLMACQYVVTMLRFLKACGFYKKNHVRACEKEISDVILPILKKCPSLHNLQNITDSNIRFDMSLKITFDSTWVNNISKYYGKVAGINMKDEYIQQDLYVNDNLIQDIAYNNYRNVHQSLCTIMCALEYNQLYNTTRDTYQPNDFTYDQYISCVSYKQIHPKSYYFHKTFNKNCDMYESNLENIMNNPFISNINIPITIHSNLYSTAAADVNLVRYYSTLLDRINYNVIDQILFWNVEEEVFNKLDRIFWKYIDRKKLDKYLYDCVTSANKTVSLIDASMREIFDNIKINKSFPDLVTEIQYYLDCNADKSFKDKICKIDKICYNNPIADDLCDK